MLWVWVFDVLLLYVSNAGDIQWCNVDEQVTDDHMSFTGLCSLSLIRDFHVTSHLLTQHCNHVSRVKLAFTITAVVSCCFKIVLINANHFITHVQLMASFFHTTRTRNEHGPLSLRPSVCHLLVLHVNGWTHHSMYLGKVTRTQCVKRD